MTLTKKQFWINFFAASVGNLFEHYDKALFAFLAPFLAPLFFEGASPIVGLILTYGIMPLGLFSKPLGALVFGWIGDKKGRRYSLYVTLLGMALTTFLMGYIPTYEQAGRAAPILLTLGRLTQNFFASGETTGGALLIIEACNSKKRALYNGIYGCSTILGIMLASAGVAWLTMLGTIEAKWRLLYWMGGLTAGLSFFIRVFTKEPSREVKPRPPIIPFLWHYRIPFLIIVITSGFSYANYYMVTSLLNGYLPLISSITRGEAMQANTFILGLDFLLLPIGGLLAMRFSKETLLMTFASLTCILAIPLYSLLPTATLFTVGAIRALFVILGVGFSVILTPYYHDLLPHESRYTLICFGSAIGSQLFGTSACSMGFYLFKHTGWAGAPALYLMGISLLATLAIKLSRAWSNRAIQVA